MLENFHEKCRGKGPSLSLFKVKHGPCVGGYTKAQWDDDADECDGEDDQAFLFNLTQRKHFPVKTPEVAIKRLAGWGPYFGEGELGAWDEPFNNNGNCTSMLDEQGY